MTVALAPLLVAVTGGSGSGKSTLAHALCDRLGACAAVLSDDHYYLDNGGRPGVPAEDVDFDAPASKDLGLLADHLAALKRGETVARPHYCFAGHRRLAETTALAPSPILVVEGIHVLAEDRLAALFDVAVYVEAPEIMRFARRMIRDVRERARSPESVVEQYLATVRPAHEAHVAPARARAGIVVENPAHTPGAVAIDVLIAPVLARIAALRPGLVRAG